MLFNFIQWVLPHHLLGKIIFYCTRITFKPWKNFLIKNFIKLYNVHLAEAEKANLYAYKHFNAFFTRKLKPEARPINNDENIIISPCDGTISQFGKIKQGMLIQAKNKKYAATELLGNDKLFTAKINPTSYINIYLSPKNYHRFHMPISGNLTNMLYVPGRLFSVSTTSANAINNLFCRNERLICLFDTKIGKMAVVMVGALFVSAIDTVWKTANKLPKNQVVDTSKIATNTYLEKGMELGKFNMGSTIILLFENDIVKWSTSITTNHSVLFGQALASTDN